jgi:hypothetical protein
VGGGDDDQGDEKHQPVARSSGGANRAGLAFRPTATGADRQSGSTAQAPGLGAFHGRELARMLGVPPGLLGQWPTLVGDGVLHHATQRNICK